MNPFLDFRSLGDLSALSRREVTGLLDTACALRHSAEAGRPQKPLRGKNIALLSDSQAAAGARAVMQAASEAGAQVAQIRPSDAGLTDPAAVRETAQLLGRLYDAVACEGLQPLLVQALQRETGIPVYENLGSLLPPVCTLARPSDPDGCEPGCPHGADDTCPNRLYVLQAMLLSTIG